jgi:murein DD-endopeptidase MepM/ murein hydrolase activator NlpD
MNELIVQQQVNRRKPSSTMVQSKPQKPGALNLPGYGVAPGHNTTIMAQIKQKPVSTQRYYRKKDAFFPPIISLSRMAFPAAFVQTDRKTEGSPQKSFIFTRLSVILLGGILLFALIALNWSQNFLNAFKISLLPGGAYALEPGADQGLGHNLAAYAGLSTPARETPDETIPLNLVETFAWESYTVKKGDSISKIAVNHAISMDAIIASNYISNAKLLREGDILRIPNMDGIPYTVKAGDSLSKISKVMGVPLEVILDANDVQSDRIQPKTVLFIPGAKMRSEEIKLVLGELFIYPIRGRLTSPFGWRNDPISGVRRYHAALDLAASMGTPIKASMDGRISSVGVNSVYGKFIIISHANGYQTMYAHMSATSVTQGVYVSQGSKIGEVGSTGYSTGPHLHFAIYKNGRAVNPLDFLKS